MEIEFNEDELRRAAADAVRQWAQDHQPDMDALTEQYAGHPDEVIKPAVAAAIRNWGGEIDDDDPDLTRIVAAIHAGERVNLDPRDV